MEIFDKEGIASLLRQKRVPSPRRAEGEVVIRDLPPPSERRKRAKSYYWPFKGEGTFGAAMTDPKLFPLQREGGGARNVGIRATTLPPRGVSGYFTTNPMVPSPYLPQVYAPPVVGPAPLRRQSETEWLNKRNRNFQGEPVKEQEIVLFEGDTSIPAPLVFEGLTGLGGAGTMGFDAGWLPSPNLWRNRSDVEKTDTAKHEVAHAAFEDPSLKEPSRSEYMKDVPQPSWNDLIDSGLSIEEADVEWNRLMDAYDKQHAVYEKKVEEFKEENPYAEHQIIYVMDFINAPTVQEREQARHFLNKFQLAENKPELSQKDIMNSLKPGKPMREYFEKISDASNERMIAQGRPPILNYREQMDEAISIFPRLRKKSGGMIERNPYPYQTRAI